MSDVINPYRVAIAQFERVDALCERLVGIAVSRGARLITSESCTAGSLAHRLSRAPGAAAVLAGGFITYTKAAKTQLVGVPKELLAEHTAVHAEIAEAMAKGALVRGNADVALSLTGVTGAEPDEDGNPIGRVFLGFASAGYITSLHCEFGRLAPATLSRLALQAALTFALSQLGDMAALQLLSKPKD